MVYMVKHSPRILNWNSRLLRQMLETAGEVDEEDHSILYYAVEAGWKINYCSKIFREIVKVAPELRHMPLESTLDEE